jgi:hypothetical protein
MRKSDTSMKWVLRLIPTLMVAYILFIVYTLVQKHNVILSTNPKASEHERSYRQQFRGIVVSLTSASVAFCITLFMKNIGVPNAFIEANFSFFYSNVITYMAERVLATDEGLRMFKANPFKGLPLALKSLTEVHFIKFFLTIMLDMFISIPIIETLAAYLLKYTPVLMAGNGYDKYIANSLRPMLMVFVAAITFLAYANMTRFQWAYPSEHQNDRLRINDSVMYLSISVAAAVFALYYVVTKQNIGVGVFYILISMALMSLLATTQKNDETSKPAKLERKRLDNNVFYGLVLFGVVTVIGIVVPLSQAGKVKLSS